MRVIEIFAGAGGAALGLKRAGLQHHALVERDAAACRTLRAAGLGPVLECDVRHLDQVARVVTALDAPDLLWSSWPCQPWSTAGRSKGAQDDRNGWPWTVDALDRFRPRWFIGENVRGLLEHRKDGHPDPFRCPRCYFERVILAQLQARFAAVGWYLIDCADLGLPQHRRRVIVWAGPTALPAPPATHTNPKAAKQCTMFGPGLSPWISIGEALGLEASGTRPEYAARPAATVTTNEWKGSDDKYRSADETPQMNKASDSLWLATGRYRLTVDECATLQGMDGWPFQGTKQERHRQIGNAVPPVLAEAIGRTLLQTDRLHKEGKV